MTSKELADLIFPNITKSITDYENMYPERDLEEGAIVTRYAPSPTGLPHMGNLLSCFMAKSFARQTNGIFFLRIEDTDTQRTVENGTSKILDVLEKFDITFDEGMVNDNDEKGNYGPYLQRRERKFIKLM